MNTHQIVTVVGLTLLVAYGIVRILSFYGIAFDRYSSYFAFYAFLAISCAVLPLRYPSLFSSEVESASNEEK